MEIKVNLNDIFVKHDEYGPTETVEEAIKRQVINSLKQDVHKRIPRLVEEHVQQKIQELIDQTVGDKAPELIEKIFIEDYTPVDKWGKKGAPTTFKNELLKALQEEMVYKRATYDSDKNTFTRAVDSAVNGMLAGWKKEFDQTVTHQLQNEAKKYAIEQLNKKFGIK